jgi:hypothetical protein
MAANAQHLIVILGVVLLIYSGNFFYADFINCDAPRA